MLSIERCRKILGVDQTVSDGDLELLRAQLYDAANTAIEIFDQNERKPEIEKEPSPSMAALSG